MSLFQKSTKTSFLQLRTEVVKLDKKSKHSYWIIARSACYFKTFLLAGEYEKDSILLNKIKQWSPFSETDHYVIWKEKYAQVWIWDKGLQHKMFLSYKSKIKITKIIPETLFQKYSFTPESNIILLKCQEGYEGQIWENNILKASRWWLQKPSLKNWNEFLRENKKEFSVSALPELCQYSWCTAPWDRSLLIILVKFIKNETVIIMTLVLLFILFFLWQFVSVLKLKENINELNSKTESIEKNTLSVIKAKNDAIKYAKLINIINDKKSSSNQLIVLSRVSDLLSSTTRIKRFSFKEKKLKIFIVDEIVDIQTYVSKLEGDSIFSNVRAEQTSDGLSLEMDINPI